VSFKNEGYRAAVNLYKNAIKISIKTIFFIMLFFKIAISVIETKVYLFGV
jgi:hypothetical protein